jgi:uncharacterized protein with von Willebrand factor type A (vWA) domain
VPGSGGHLEGSVPHDEGGEDLKRIEELLGREGASPMSGGPTAKDLSPQNLEHDRYDSRLWRELCEASGELEDLVRDEGAPPTFAALLNDLFLSYFKAQPNLLPEERVEPRHRHANRPFVERALEDPDTYRARAATRLDVASSGLAALAAGERLLQEIKNKPDLTGFFERAAEAPRSEGGVDEQAQRSGDAPADEPGAEEEARPDGQPVAEGEASEGEQHAPEVPGRDVRRAVRCATCAGREEADGVAGAMAGWGLAPADLARFPLGERLELLKLLSGPRMARMLEMVGKMRNLARKSARDAVRERADELHSVKSSGDVFRLLPSELAALASDIPERRLAAEARLLAGGSLSWELNAHEQEKRGPVVAMIDSSGSMEGHPMEWATAVALGVVDLAAGRGGLPKRSSALVHFNARVVSEVRFAPGERDPRKLLCVATVGASGGTAYEPAIERALEIAAESAYDGADLVLVTDERCRLGEPFLRRFLGEKERRRMRLFSVLIGARSSGELERYSDGVWTLRDLAGSYPDEAAAELFGSL